MVSEAAPPFDATLEISTDELSSLDNARPERHISVTPIMSWSCTSSTKYSFITANGLRFEADFFGDIQLKLSEPVLLGLKGAVITPRPTPKQSKLPFKLAFPKGVTIKTKSRILNTFPDPPASLFKPPSWFTSQPPTSAPPSPRESNSPSPSPHRRSSSPIRQSSPPMDDIPQAKRQLSSGYITSEKRTSTPAPPPIPLCEAPFRDQAGVARPIKRPRESAGDLSGPSTLAGRSASYAVTPVRESEQGMRAENLPGDDSMAQKQKSKRRRKNKKSNVSVPARNVALDMAPGFWSHLAGPYTPLADAAQHKFSKISIMGIVRGISLPKWSVEWTVSVELFDPSTKDNNAFVVNLFLEESTKDCLPSVQAGDVLMLLKVSVVGYNGTIRGTGYKDSFTWAGYSPTQKVHFHSVSRAFKDEEHCPFFTPGPDELKYAGQLVDWWSALQDSKSKTELIPTLMTAPKGRSLITLAEAKADVFFNCVVEILYTVPPGDQFAEMFITDYTTHPHFYDRRPRENDKYEHVKIFGQRVLKVILWGDTQLEHVKELETPGYYYIDNLRVKFDSKGHLEGTLQDERRKIDKLRKDDPMLEDLLERKAEYMKSPPSESLSKNGHTRGNDFNLHSAGDLLPPPIIPPKKFVELKQQRSQGPSPTRLLYYNIVHTPIQKVLGYPKCPEIFRIRGRIAAFEPYKLENFTHAYCTHCRADIPSGSAACHDCADVDKEYVAYEYRFRICVEEDSANDTGIRASLLVDVSGKEAEMFLSGLPPDNLRNIKNARKLRERLSPVLGNLETYQCDLATGDSLKARVHGQYFDMLIQSHHSLHKSDGAFDNKRYKLWGTELLLTPSE